MIRPIGLIVALAALLLPAACRRAPAIEAHPALWRVVDRDTTIWLFGTIHVLPRDVKWRTAAVDAAIGRADTLVTEIPDGDTMAQAARFLKMARAEGLPPVQERVPAGEQAILARAASASGVSLATLDGMKSWAAAVAIAVAATRQTGATRENGVEAVLARAFATKHRLAFESLDGQLGLFDALPEDRQRVLLVRSAKEALAARPRYRRTLSAWAAGDEARIAASFDSVFKGASGLEYQLLTGRNARWAGWIAARMDPPGAILVAVGAGHLAGPKSVVAMLQKRGLKVERIE